MDSKEDTLTQSQMMKAVYKESFLVMQLPEFRGMEK
jgi:hypothetical protein